MTNPNLGELEFTAEDFKVLAETKYGEVTTIESAVKRANARLAEKLAKAPVVTGFDAGSGRWLWDTDAGKNDTHTGRLVCIARHPLKPT